MWGTRDHEDEMWFPPEGEAARAAAFLQLSLAADDLLSPSGEGEGREGSLHGFQEKKN